MKWITKEIHGIETMYVDNPSEPFLYLEKGKWVLEYCDFSIGNFYMRVFIKSLNDQLVFKEDLKQYYENNYKIFLPK